MLYQNICICSATITLSGSARVVDAGHAYNLTANRYIGVKSG
jgi:hypothetical protein